MVSDLHDFLKNLQVTPRDLFLYKTAFTHRSFLNESKENLESNERLEFLGDSVLSLIISSYLYLKRKSDNEGDLTALRAFIVKTDSLAKASKKLDLGKFLKMSKGEEISGGRENTQILANTYEALVGAIFLDLGLDMTKQFVTQTLLPLFDKEIHQGPPRDPKSQLQEVVQSKFQISPKYKVLSSFGPDHAKMFQVGVYLKDEQIGKGLGPNKQQAEESAAKIALEKILK